MYGAALGWARLRAPRHSENRYPVALRLRMESSVAFGDNEHVARKHRMNVRKSAHSRDHGLHHLMKSRFGLQLFWHLWVLKNGFDLGPVEDRPVVQMIEKRPDTKPVPHEDEFSLFGVEQSEGKLAPQMLYKGKTVLSVELECDFTVAFGLEVCPRAGQLRPRGFVVIELAVYRQNVLPVLTEQRLRPAFTQIDDREPGVAHGDANRGFHMGTLAIGAAVLKRRHHPL